jgi:nitrogen-specific signal transduction histidine kinase
LVASVADSRSGVIPQNLDRIFDPMFTAKPEGVVMGLSICRSIVGLWLQVDGSAAAGG